MASAVAATDLSRDERLAILAAQPLTDVSTAPRHMDGFVMVSPVFARTILAALVSVSDSALGTKTALVPVSHQSRRGLLTTVGCLPTSGS